MKRLADEADTLLWITLVRFENSPRTLQSRNLQDGVIIYESKELAYSVANLSRALDKLEEAVNTPRTGPLVAEGTVQRFEFVIELFWKTLKRALEYEGRITKTPRETLRETYAVGWINDETLWLDMLDCRNETSHLYLDPALVDAIYDRIKSYYPEMRRLFEFLQDRYPSSAGME